MAGSASFKSKSRKRIILITLKRFGCFAVPLIISSKEFLSILRRLITLVLLSSYSRNLSSKTLLRSRSSVTKDLARSLLIFRLSFFVIRCYFPQNYTYFPYSQEKKGEISPKIFGR